MIFISYQHFEIKRKKICVSCLSETQFPIITCCRELQTEGCVRHSKVWQRSTERLSDMASDPSQESVSARVCWDWKVK